MNLSNNQKLFCQEYLKLGMNGTQAYLNVYKSVKKEATARTNASRLLTNANIQEYVKELQEKVEEKAIVSIEDIVKELYKIGFSNVKDLYDESGKLKEISNIDTNVASVISSIKVQQRAGAMNLSLKKESKDTDLDVDIQHLDEWVKEIKFCDKLKALELLGKYLGMFKETVEIKNPTATKVLDSINNQLMKRNK